MRWPNIFRFNKNRKAQGQNIISHYLDQKLVNKVRHNFWPKWPQLKYIKHFLTPNEKKIIGLSFVTIAIAIIIGSVVFIIKNNVISPTNGGEYSEAMIGQPKYINPLFSSTGDIDSDLTSLVYSGLFHYQNQKFIPDLAANYTISDDKKTYDIDLRHDVKWSDKEPFTADDVVFTFETINNSEVGSPLFVTFQGVHIEKTGDYSVRFTLKEPFAPFLSSLTVGIIPRHIWGNIPPSGIRLAKNNLQPVGTGSFKFSKMAKDAVGNIQTYTVERNDDFYSKPPYLKDLIFKFYTDYNQAANALKSQDVKALSFVPNDLTDKIVGKNFQLYKFTLPQYTALFFNQDRSDTLKENDTRTALLLATDKAKILKDALSGNGETINSPIIKGMLGYNASTTLPAFNIQKANELLDKKWTRIQPEEYYQLTYDNLIKQQESVIKELQNSTTTANASSTIEKIKTDTMNEARQSVDAEQVFYRQDKNKNILQFTITTANTPEYKQVAEAIAGMWRAAGIKVKIESVDGGQMNRDIIKDRNYEILLYGEIVGNDPDLFPFWHSSQTTYPGLNLANYVNRTADKLLEDARVSADPTVRADKYQKFQDIINKELPAIFLYTPTHNFVVNKEIKGIQINQIMSPADRYADINDWYIKTKREIKIK